MKKRAAKKSIPPIKTAKRFAAAVPQASAVALPPKPDRLIDRAELLRIIPVSYVTIWKWMREGNFPRSLNCGGKIVWLESEIERWIKSRPAQPLKGDDQGAAL
jgi:prophage regulatory protein